MNTQQVKININQVRPEALNLFYAHIVRQCALAKENPDIYKEYLESRKEKQNG